MMENTKDKRVKREIANSNERRRMQSINAGFQKLKRLLPVNDGEKLSKAAILQNASEFIQQIEKEKKILYEQNTFLREILIKVKNGTALDDIDLDAIPIIPINTHIASSNNDHNNSNDTTTDNTSNDDCIKNVTIRNGSANNIKNNATCETNNNNDNKNSELTNVSISIDQIKPISASDRDGLVSSSVAKAAIALPLEVPFTSGTAIRVDHHHHRHDLHSDTPPSNAQKIMKTEPVDSDPQDPAPKGQNLDTICKAIMEIEGDRVFTNGS